MAKRRKPTLRKHPKDPRRPKRPMGTFFVFLRDNREAAANSPLMNYYKQGMTAKVAGRMWKKAAPDAKDRAVQQAGQDRERYHRAAKQYRPPTKDQWQHIMNHWPKRSRVNYNFFVKEHFGQIWKANPGSKFGFVSRQVANQWAQASEEEKERYTQLFFQDRERYLREVEALWQSLTQDHAKVAGPTESPSQPQPTSQEEHQTSDDEDSSSDGSSSEDSSSDEDNKS